MARAKESIDIGRASRAKCPATSRKNPVKAIRLKCLDCSGGSSTEVEKCVIPHCALYPFRFGRNPFLPEKTAAQKEAALRALKSAKTSRVGIVSENQFSSLDAPSVGA